MRYQTGVSGSKEASLQSMCVSHRMAIWTKKRLKKGGKKMMQF
jgi:hypothetical protein